MIGFVALAILAELASSDRAALSIAERIEWGAPSGCVVEAELEKAVSSQLHQAPEMLVRHVRGVASRGESGFSVVFEVWEGDAFVGKRKLELPGTECSLHTETLSFVLTLLLEGGKVDEPEPTDVEPPAPEKAPVPIANAPEKKRAETRPAAAPRSPKLLFSGLVGAEAKPFLLPSLGLSLGGGVGLIAFAHYSLELFGGFQLPEERALSNGEGVRLSGGGGRVEACYLFRPGAFRVGPCAGFALESRSAEGYGFSENRRETVTESFPLLLARLDWLVLPNAFLRGSFGMGASLTPHEFVNQNGRVLFTESPFFPFLGISAGATLAP